jgi:hypothetical protein
MIDSFVDTESDDYDFLDDEDIDLYGDGLDEDYDEFEAESYSPESWEDYEADIYDDFPELAEVLRETLHERYEDASPEEMEEALFNIMDQMTPAEGFNFTSALRQISKTGQGILKDPMVGQIAGTALPIAGGALGTFVGGPVGTAIGAQLGQAAVQAFPGAKKPAIPTAPPPTVPVTPTPPNPPVQPAVATPQGGSTAAAQLLQLTQNPVMLQSLLALALGSHGKGSISITPRGQAVQPGPLMSLLGQLAGQAASDADQLLWESEETPDYLLDSEGRYVVDPAVPEDHAEALYEALLAAENIRLIGEDARSQPWSNYLPFPAGTTLVVEYETFIRNFDIGNGSVLERTADLFKAKIHIDKWDRFNIPETYAMLMVEYKQDGPGNRAMVVVNGREYSDHNVTIRSGKSTRDIFMSINLLGQRIDQISIKRESTDKAKLKFKAGDKEHVLILTKN